MTQSEELNIDDQNSNELFCKFNSKPVWQRESTTKPVQSPCVPSTTTHVKCHLLSRYSRDLV